MTPALEVHDLTVAYQYKPVLWNVDFALPSAACVAVVGPNGAGKSTLLKAVLSLVPLASGYAKIFGKPAKENLAKVAYVPQREEVDWDFPITVRDVVLMGRYGKLPFFTRCGNADRAAADEALFRVGMEQFARTQIRQLSGGQQQRVFIARALCQDAELYLMDEPFAGVDAATEKAIGSLFGELKSKGKTVICVHHDLHTIAEYFDWVVMLNLRLVASGKVADVFTPQNLQQTYGGRLGLLADVAEELRKREWKKRAETPS